MPTINLDANASLIQTLEESLHALQESSFLDSQKETKSDENYVQRVIALLPPQSSKQFYEFGYLDTAASQKLPEVVESLIKKIKLRPKTKLEVVFIKIVDMSTDKTPKYPQIKEVNSTQF